MLKMSQKSPRDKTLPSNTLITPKGKNGLVNIMTILIMRMRGARNGGGVDQKVLGIRKI